MRTPTAAVAARNRGNRSRTASELLPALEGRMRNATRPRPAHLSTGADADRFGGIDEAAPRPRACEPDYSAIAESAEFLDLRARLRRFVFPMSAVFLIWYLGYVIAAAYLPEFMG